LQNVWKCTVFVHFHSKLEKSGIMTPNIFLKNSLRVLKNAEFYGVLNLMMSTLKYSIKNVIGKKSCEYCVFSFFSKFFAHNFICNTFCKLWMLMRKKLYIFKRFARSKNSFFCLCLSIYIYIKKKIIKLKPPNVHYSYLQLAICTMYVQRRGIPKVPECLSLRPNWLPPPYLPQASVSPSFWNQGATIVRGWVRGRG
jgi:hypothetical protein